MLPKRTFTILFILFSASMASFAQIPDEPPPTTKEMKGEDWIENPDVMPSFPGGKEKMKLFIKKHKGKCPDMINSTIKRSVTLGFIVEPDGSIRKIWLVNQDDPGCADEAAKILKAMPKWIPGKKNGKKVSVKMQLTIQFP